MLYPAIELAKYIVKKCSNENEPISNLQLQKILYYIQRDYLKSGSVAFSDKIEAWQFGPVVPNVYYHFCSYGSMPISRNYKNKNIEIDVEDAAIIDTIVEEKRRLEPWDLVNDTHKKGGAWDLIYENGKGNHKEIPLELIRKVG